MVVERELFLNQLMILPIMEGYFTVLNVRSIGKIRMNLENELTWI